MKIIGSEKNDDNVVSHIIRSTHNGNIHEITLCLRLGNCSQV